MKNDLTLPPLPVFQNPMKDWMESQDLLNKEMVGLMRELVAQQTEQSKQIADLRAAIDRLQP